MKRLFAFVLMLLAHSLAWAQVQVCSPTVGVTSGSLTLKCGTTHPTGISPLLVFFDCTATTDTGLTDSTAIPGNGYPSSTDNPFQHIYYQYSFGDPNPSGTGTWIYGSNGGHNSRNRATGPLVAHLYVDDSTTTDFVITAQVWAYSNGGNTATCTLPINVYSQTGSNGFLISNTTCVSPSGNFTGCPAGAAHVTTASLATATAAANWGSTKLLLFHCGESWTSGNAVQPTFAGPGRADAYPFDSTCRNQSTNRPQFTGANLWNIHSASTDVAVSNLDFETSGNTAGTALTMGTDNYPPVTTQVTFYNTKVSGYNTSYALAFCSQCGLVQVVQGTMGANQGTWLELVGNGCINGNLTFDCGGTKTPYFQSCSDGVEDTLGTPLYYVPSYIAVLGSSFNGTGTPNNGQGIETLRFSGGHCIHIENTTFAHANNVGAVMKAQCSGAHNTQQATSGSVCSVWTFTDNLFQGPAGGQTVEQTPQNGVTDERMYLVLFERNLIQPAAGSGGPGMLVSARFASYRNNVCDNSAAGGECWQICRRGVEWNNNGTLYSTAPDQIEFLNNTTRNGGISVATGGACSGPAASNSTFENALHYQGSATTNSGTGNTVSHNTTNTALNPSFVNTSGSFSLITDYKPTANFSGADATVSNFFDCAGYAWVSPGYTLGACSQVAH